MTSIPIIMLKNKILFVFAILCLICITSCERVDENGHPKSFSSYAYYDEWKRIPLVFPFEINDFYGSTGISRWEYYKKPSKAPVDLESPMQITKIQRFAVTNGHLFGEHDTGWVRPSGEIQYFVFSFSKTNVVRFSDQKEFSCYCTGFGGDVKQMRPFLEQWETYWLQYDKQK